ncbi:MAG: hypothetical protein IT336_02910 [Thermomicrobiales bacterium]|nr:hypothetical protein [Thermomicrobiales bacterium]
MERFANSWRLTKASWAVLKTDKELIVFPIVSAIAAALVALLFAVPLWVSGYFDRVDEEGVSNIASYAVLFVFYLVLYTVINFCNAALVGAALIRLRGGDPTAADGFRMATHRMGPIVGYALIGATVGVILQAIRDKSGLLGDLVAGFTEMAWGLATYLVVPVLVVENVGPVEAVKRSAALFKRTWGEQVIGNAGIGLAVGLVVIAAIAIGTALIVIASSIGGTVLAIVIGAVVVLAIAAIIAVGAALKGIYTAALYGYAADGAPGSFFPDDLIRGAFVPK